MRQCLVGEGHGSAITDGQTGRLYGIRRVEPQIHGRDCAAYAHVAAHVEARVCGDIPLQRYVAPTTAVHADRRMVAGIVCTFDVVADDHRERTRRVDRGVDAVHVSRFKLDLAAVENKRTRLRKKPERIQLRHRTADGDMGVRNAVEHGSYVRIGWRSAGRPVAVGLERAVRSACPAVGCESGRGRRHGLLPHDKRPVYELVGPCRGIGQHHFRQRTAGH